MKRLFAASCAFAALTCLGCETSGPLTAPTELSGAPLGTGVQLSWRDNSEAEDGYEIERAGSTGSYRKVGSVSFDTEQFYDGSILSSGAAYTYRVRGFSSGGVTSAYSNELNILAPVTGSVNVPDGGADGGP